MKHQLYFGGTRLAARDLWASSGQGYWPASVPSATTNYDFGISGHQSDGRSFFSERNFQPEELGDEALLSYLASQTIVSGDELHITMMPIGTVVENVTVDVFKMPAGLTFSLVDVNLNDGTETPLVATINSTHVGTIQRALMPMPIRTGDYNHMLVLKVVAVPVGGINWETVHVRVTASGNVHDSGGGYLDVSETIVP